MSNLNVSTIVAILDGKFSNPNVKTKIITVLREILFSFSHLFLSLFLSNFFNGLMIVLLFHSFVYERDHSLSI